MKTALALIGSVVLFITSQAAVKTVIGNAGTGWNNAANWSPGGVPESGDEVVIPAGRTISVKGGIYPTAIILRIKIAGTLDFDPSGRLNLLSGSNVQLQSSTAWITSNGTSSELILINGVTKYRGSIDGNIQGPKYASAVTGTSPNGFDNGVLPVKLKEFTATIQGSKVLLSWMSELESELWGYKLERSSNGRSWQELSTISPKGSGSLYAFTDLQPVSGLNYYRLRSTDLDGQFEYSSILSVQMQTQSITKFQYLQPAEIILISLIAGNHPALSAQLFTFDGKLQRQQILAAGTNSSYQVSVNGLTKGMYVVVVKDRNQVLASGKVVVR